MEEIISLLDGSIENFEQNEEIIDLSSLEIENSVILLGNSWQTWN